MNLEGLLGSYSRNAMVVSYIVEGGLLNALEISSSLVKAASL